MRSLAAVNRSISVLPASGIACRVTPVFSAISVALAGITKLMLAFGVSLLAATTTSILAVDTAFSAAVRPASPPSVTVKVKVMRVSSAALAGIKVGACSVVELNRCNASLLLLVQL